MHYRKIVSEQWQLGVESCPKAVPMLSIGYLKIDPEKGIELDFVAEPPKLLRVNTEGSCKLVAIFKTRSSIYNLPLS